MFSVKSFFNWFKLNNNSKFNDEKYIFDQNENILSNSIVPLKIDNRNICTIPNDQKDKPYCVGFAVANLLESIYWKKTGKLINLNAEEIYKKTKLKFPDGKNGTTIKNVLLTISDIYNYKNKLQIKFIFPSEKNYLEKIKKCIHKYDFLIGGFKIFSSWYICNKKNFIINDKGIPIENHALLIVGYDETGCYIQNSWGKDWGFKSFAIIPWKYFEENFLYCCYIINI